MVKLLSNECNSYFKHLSVMFSIMGYKLYTTHHTNIPLQPTFSVQILNTQIYPFVNAYTPKCLLKEVLEPHYWLMGQNKRSSFYTQIPSFVNAHTAKWSC